MSGRTANPQEFSEERIQHRKKGNRKHTTEVGGCGQCNERKSRLANIVNRISKREKDNRT